MRVMQEGMRLMGDGMGMDMNKDESSKMDDMDMIKRMDMMEERMGMMQMMMGGMRGRGRGRGDGFRGRGRGGFRGGMQ